MIRTPLRPLARILPARDRGENPDAIERENLRLRHEQMRDRARARAEGRLFVLAVMFFVGFAVIGARMGLMAASEPQEPRLALAGPEIHAGRADILDRRGRVLATNLVTHALYAETRHMIDAERAARELATIFPDLDAESMTRRFLDPNRRFMWLRSRLSPEQVQLVHDIGEPGLQLGPRQMRLYPNGRLAAHVLGGAAFGEQGVRAAEIIGTAGVERHFDERLRDPQQSTNSLQLSLDLSVQATTAEVLEGGMRLMNARGATAVMMDVHTGEVISLVSLPDFDPNNRPPPPTEGEPADSPIFNRALQGVYELGSVMKTFTMAQALEEEIITPETVIDTRSPMQVGRFRISDFRNYGPELSATDVFVRSSNVGTARIAQEIGGERQSAFLQSLGFLDATGLEMAEASRARPLFPQRWGEISTVTVSYGHGLSTSPVHLAAAYASMVNGGTRITPTILRQTVRQRGERVVSEATSAVIRDMMRQVVVRGTASFAEVPGYSVGGKTGTADKPRSSGGYHDDKVIATFAGIFPAHEPRYVLVVTLDEPVETSGSEPRRTAGWTAVPVAAEIIRRTAPLMGMRPEIAAAPLNGLTAVRN